MTPQALSQDEVAGLLDANAAAVAAELRALPDEALRWHPDAGEWCVQEALGHVIEAERRGFAGRIREMLTAEEPTLKGWDQVEVARGRRDCDKPLEALLKEFLDERSASVQLVDGLTDRDLERAGTHEVVGRLTVAELLHEWVHHDRNHFRQMLANVQAYAWPQMGNAQRFSEPH